MSKIKSTLRRAIKGLPPKYRGKVHKNAHSHARSVIEGDYSPCAEYVWAAEGLPENGVVVPWAHGGWLVYRSPF